MAHFFFTLRNVWVAALLASALINVNEVLACDNPTIQSQAGAYCNLNTGQTPDGLPCPWFVGGMQTGQTVLSVVCRVRQTSPQPGSGLCKMTGYESIYRPSLCAQSPPPQRDFASLSRFDKLPLYQLVLMRP